jgi:casein kinase II subunit alpha
MEDLGFFGTGRDGPVISRSRVFAYVNEIKGPDWFEHNDFRPVWNRPEDYTILKRIGRGKYSTVYKGCYKDERFVAIKVLVPLDPKRYLREVKILHNLKSGPGIVKLLDLVRDPASNTFAFVFEWVEFP